MIFKKRKLRKDTIPPYSLIKLVSEKIDKIIGRDYLDDVDFSGLDDLPEAWKHIIMDTDIFDALIKTSMAYGAVSTLCKYIKVTESKRVRHYRYKIRRRRFLITALNKRRIKEK